MNKNVPTIPRASAPKTPAIIPAIAPPANVPTGDAVLVEAELVDADAVCTTEAVSDVMLKFVLEVGSDVAESISNTVISEVAIGEADIKAAFCTWTLKAQIGCAVTVTSE